MSLTRLAEQITADCLVHDVIDRHPQTVAVFVQYRLQCIGCYISPFHTIADVAREYALGLESLLVDLNQATGSGP
jgi:hybrid cluster-associated redox disulfide protein